MTQYSQVGLPAWRQPAPEPEARDAINTEGVVSVGELNTRVMREALTESDFTEARAAAASEAYRECQAYAQERIDRAGPYDDTRALRDLVTWLTDKIREVHSDATNGGG